MNIIKKHPFIFLGIFVGLNIILIYSNAERQEQVNTLTTRVSSLESSQGFSPKALTYVKDDIELSDDGLTLVAIFTEKSCAACMGYELPNFEKMYKQFNERVQAYFIGSDKNYLKQFGIEFSFKTAGAPRDIIQYTNLTITDPVVLVVDPSGMIHDMYIAETGNHEKSDLFYQRMHSLFKSFHPGSSNIETASN